MILGRGTPGECLVSDLRAPVGRHRPVPCPILHSRDRLTKLLPFAIRGLRAAKNLSGRRIVARTDAGATPAVSRRGRPAPRRGSARAAEVPRSLVRGCRGVPSSAFERRRRAPGSVPAAASSLTPRPLRRRPSALASRGTRRPPAGRAVPSSEPSCSGSSPPSSTPGSPSRGFQAGGRVRPSRRNSSERSDGHLRAWCALQWIKLCSKCQSALEAGEALESSSLTQRGGCFFAAEASVVTRTSVGGHRESGVLGPHESSLINTARSWSRSAPSERPRASGG